MDDAVCARQDDKEPVAVYPDPEAVEHVRDTLVHVIALARHLSELPVLDTTARALARALTNELEAVASLHDAYEPRAL